MSEGRENQLIRQIFRYETILKVEPNQRHFNHMGRPPISLTIGASLSRIVIMNYARSTSRIVSFNTQNKQQREKERLRSKDQSFEQERAIVDEPAIPLKCARFIFLIRKK
jgi:hypothetical protein